MNRPFLAALTLSFGAALPALAEPLPWSKVCNSGTPCFVERQVAGSAGKPAALRVRFDRQAEKGQARLTLIAPLTVFLPTGIQLNVDASKTIGLPFLTCSAGGCEASAVLDADAQRQFAGGKTLTVHYALAQAPVEVPVELAGLSAALNSLAQ
jgi:invasion protein IalB